MVTLLFYRQNSIDLNFTHACLYLSFFYSLCYAFLSNIFLCSLPSNIRLYLYIYIYNYKCFYLQIIKIENK